VHRRVVLLSLLLWASLSAAAPVAAKEAAGGGVFLDLPGCLASAPCSNTVTLFPQLRLVLGNGIVVAHLDVLHLLPAGSALWLPYVVLQFPLQVSPEVAVTPYVGIAPLLGSVGSSSRSVDWLIKLGDLFSFEGFQLYTEVVLPLPFVSVPSLAFGSLATF